MPRNPSAAKKYAREVSELQMHASRLRAYSAPNLKSYATIHKLPYDRLRRAYLKLPTRSDREASNQLLSPAQELALVRYLDSIDAIGLGIRRSQVEQQATALLAESYLGVDEAPPPLGTNWARRWLQRHPKYKRVKARPMEIQRKLAQQPEALRAWFTKLESLIQQLGVLPRDTYNMDETGCRIGVATSQYVYSRYGRQIFIPNANNRELMTLVECVSADGEAIAPMVIVKAATVIEHWIPDLPEDYLIHVSDSGYSNDQIALDWLIHFNKMTEKRRLGVWRLLLVDGHGSHETREFAQYAEDNRILLFALPPHTTHLLQPLDVGCFQPLKWYHGRQLDWAARSGSKDISKADFLSTIAEIRRLTFTRSTILSGWKRTGLAPFKPEIVLDQLKLLEGCQSSDDDERTPPPPVRSTTPIIISSPPRLASSPSRAPIRRYNHVKIDLQQAQLVRRAYTPTTPEPAELEPGDAAWHTPKTIRQIQAQEPFVQAVLRQHLPREVAASVIKHQIGVSALARTAEGLQRELRKTEAAVNAKDERRRRKRRALGVKGGPIYAQDARAMVQQRQTDDAARAVRDVTAKQLRQVTVLLNKHLKILPTVRNWGTKYVKRAAAGVVVYREMNRWVHPLNDTRFNDEAASKLERIQQPSSLKYRRKTTNELTPAADVAGQVRCLVDPYNKLIITKLQEKRLQDEQDSEMIAEENSSLPAYLSRSQSVKNESQPTYTELPDGAADGRSRDDEASDANLADPDDAQNDWGLQ